MQRISILILNNLTLRVFLPLLAVALATTWYGLFYSVALFGEMTGGLGFMDMQPWLQTGGLFDQIRSYPDAAVNYYIGWSLFDYAWPFVTFTTMLFITGWLLNFVSPRWRGRFWLFVATAYGTVLFDWAENAGFIALVSGLPAEPLWLAQLTLGLHAGKLVCNMLFNAAFWVLALAALTNFFRRKMGH